MNAGEKYELVWGWMKHVENSVCGSLGPISSEETFPVVVLGVVRWAEPGWSLSAQGLNA